MISKRRSAFRMFSPPKHDRTPTDIMLSAAIWQVCVIRLAEAREEAMTGLLAGALILALKLALIAQVRTRAH